MEKEFVPYNLALILKELGFCDPCFGFYDTDGYLYIQYARNGNIFKRNNGCLSPTFSQIFRWFRVKYKLLSFVDIDDSYRIYCNDIKFDLDIDSKIFKTYEEAELECLKKLIEIAKEQNVK